MALLNGVLDRGQHMRLFAAVVIQPLIVGAVAFVLFPMLLLDAEGQTLAGGYPTDPADAALSVAAGTGLVAAVVTIAGALPAAVFLMKRGRATLSMALLFGVGFGVLPYVLLSVAAGGRTYGVAGLLRGLAFSSAVGVSGAVVFWMIALWRRSPEEQKGG